MEIEKVGLNPVNPVKIPEPLPVKDLNPATNPAQTPQKPRQTPHSEIVAEPFLMGTIASIARRVRTPVFQSRG